MRTIGIALSGLLAAALAGSAVAASLTRTPGQLMLQKGDFSAKAKYVNFDMPANVINSMKQVGVQASGAAYEVSVPGKEHETVNGTVFVTASESQAKKTYDLFIADAKREKKGSPWQGLPKLGDEQLALYSTNTNQTSLFVRRKKVVWQLGVTPFGVMDHQKVRAETQRYAQKQSARVGAG